MTFEHYLLAVLENPPRDPPRDPPADWLPMPKRHMPLLRDIPEAHKAYVPCELSDEELDEYMDLHNSAPAVHFISFEMHDLLVTFPVEYKAYLRLSKPLDVSSS